MAPDYGMAEVSTPGASLRSIRSIGGWGSFTANLNEKLTAEDRERLASSGVQTAVRYVDAAGRSRYMGTSQLKRSQTPTQ